MEDIAYDQNAGEHMQCEAEMESQDKAASSTGEAIASKAVYCNRSRAEGVKRCKGKMESNPKLLEQFMWYRYNSLERSLFCSYCERYGTVSQNSGGVWREFLFSNWKKAWEKTELLKKKQNRALVAENAWKNGTQALWEHGSLCSDNLITDFFLVFLQSFTSMDETQIKNTIKIAFCTFNAIPITG